MSHWRASEDGSTIGQRGSEGGTIVRDQEHLFGARITLESDCRNIPFAVTCGVFGWFVHTRYADTEARAEFGAMAGALGAICESLPLADDPEAEQKFSAVHRAIGEFVERFP